MDLNFWARLFQGITAAGALLLVIGTLGFYYVKDLNERRTRDRHNSEVRTLDHRIDRLETIKGSLEDRLLPFENVARWKYPKANSKEALDKLSSDLGKAKARAIDIAKKTGPRSLEGNTISILVEAMRKYPGMIVQIMSPKGNDEAQRFAEQIAEVFKDAGWTVEPTQEVFTQPAVGIVVLVNRNPPPPAAHKLSEILLRAEYTVVGRLNYSLKDNQVRIIVGTRP